MRSVFPAVALPLAGLVILLSGCNESSESSVSPIVSEVPATLNGELSSQSQVNLNDGSRTQSFDLQLQGGQLYRAESSGALKQPVLLLLSEQGEVVSGPRPETLYLQPEQDGRYKLAVSGSTATDFGPFRLQLNPAELVNEGELPMPSDILGRLRSGSTNHGNHYSLKVEEEGLYELVMRSSEFDAVLKLRGKDVNRTDDDSAGDTDARLLTLLPEGSYQLIAGGIDSDAEGIYSLSFKRWEMPEGISLADGAELRVGGEATGMLTGQPQRFTLVVEQSGLLEVRMTSTDLDSLLELSGPGVNARDDDSGGGYDALLNVPVEPGSYRLTATQHGSGEGLFTLATALTEVAALDGHIAPGETRTGRLTAGQPAAATLQIEQDGHYRIILRSADFDAMLSLQWDGNDRTDDDSAGGTDAQLELYLQAGEYQVVPGGYGDEGTGSFVLSVSEPL